MKVKKQISLLKSSRKNTFKLVFKELVSLRDHLMFPLLSVCMVLKEHYKKEYFNISSVFSVKQTKIPDNQQVSKDGYLSATENRKQNISSS